MRPAYRPVAGDFLHPFPLHRQSQLGQPFYHRPAPFQAPPAETAQDVLKLLVPILQIVAQDVDFLRRVIAVRAQLNGRNQLQIGMGGYRLVRLGQSLGGVVVGMAATFTPRAASRFTSSVGERRPSEAWVCRCRSTMDAILFDSPVNALDG